MARHCSERGRGARPTSGSFFGGAREMARTGHRSALRLGGPRRAAWATAAARDETLSLLRMLATWRWTVCSLTNSRSAIAWLFRPSATSRSTSISRAGQAGAACRAGLCRGRSAAGSDVEQRARARHSSSAFSSASRSIARCASCARRLGPPERARAPAPARCARAPARTARRSRRNRSTASSRCRRAASRIAVAERDAAGGEARRRRSGTVADQRGDRGELGERRLRAARGRRRRRARARADRGRPRGRSGSAAARGGGTLGQLGGGAQVAAIERELRAAEQRERMRLRLLEQRRRFDEPSLPAPQLGEPDERRRPSSPAGCAASSSRRGASAPAPLRATCRATCRSTRTACGTRRTAAAVPISRRTPSAARTTAPRDRSRARDRSGDQVAARQADRDEIRHLAGDDRGVDFVEAAHALRRPRPTSTSARPCSARPSISRSTLPTARAMRIAFGGAARARDRDRRPRAAHSAPSRISSHARSAHVAAVRRAAAARAAASRWRRRARRGTPSSPTRARPRRAPRPR